MRLNHDCVRDILLYVEENTDHPHDVVEFNNLVQHLDYERDSIHYHLNKLSQAKFLKCNYADDKPTWISTLTWEGHTYIDNIRDKTVWEKLKDGSVDISTMSFEVIGNLAKELSLAYAKKRFGLE